MQELMVVCKSHVRLSKSNCYKIRCEFNYTSQLFFGKSYQINIDKQTYSLHIIENIVVFEAAAIIDRNIYFQGKRDHAW